MITCVSNGELLQHYVTLPTPNWLLDILLRSGCVGGSPRREGVELARGINTKATSVCFDSTGPVATRKGPVLNGSTSHIPAYAKLSLWAGEPKSSKKCSAAAKCYSERSHTRRQEANISALQVQLARVEGPCCQNKISMSLKYNAEANFFNISTNSET
jgi:hypothetical protein